MFANPFAACYVKPTAKTMGGNGRRVEWYKANRATQRGFVRSTLSSFRSPPPPPLSIFHLLFSLHTAGLPFPSYFGYCILMLAYSRVTLCSSLASVKILFASTSTFSPSRLSLSLIYSFGRVKFCGFKLPVRATLSISDIRHARVKLAFSCIS